MKEEKRCKLIMLKIRLAMCETLHVSPQATLTTTPYGKNFHYPHLTGEEV